MSILKYKDPKTGEFKRINPYKAELSFVGKDGVVVNKAANSEEVEISGSGCVQKYSGLRGYRRAYITDETNWDTYIIIRQAGDNSANTLIQRKPDGSGEIVMPETPVDLSITNKKYVADNYVEKVKFTNLEQALNGYILDTTKEAYADLDSAVLKDSVAVGDNVYPIADKTRALVTRIEGKTTKMVQVLDKSKFSATSTPTTGVTVTKTDDGGLHVLGTSASSGGRNSWGITVKIEKGHKYLSLLKGNNKITTPFVTLKSDTSQYVGFVADIVTSTIEGECYYGFNLAAEDYDETIYPQLFDLTAMNREDITTVEQFKAEFPELYPYENGNIYPAKISGVKFTGKNLFNYNWTRIVEGDVRNASIVKALENGAILQGNESDTPGNQYYQNGWFSPGYESDKYKIYLRAGDRVTISANYEILESDNTLVTVGLHLYGIINTQLTSLHSVKTKVLTRIVQTFTIKSNDSFYPIFTLNSNKVKITDIQIEISDAPTAYEPYTEPVSVTLPQTYELHGIGDYKDYLEITKNENNELYTLKKVQVIDKHVFDGTENWGTYPRTDFTNKAYNYNLGAKFVEWTIKGNVMNLLSNIRTLLADEKGYTSGDLSPNIYFSLPNIANSADMKAHVLAMHEAGTPYIFYGTLATPVETVIATNLTYEQVTAIRHNGGLIEVEGNANKGYARPTVKNTIVYRLTATNMVEG